MYSAISDIFKRLNGWRDDQVSGFEIFINDFDKLDEMTAAVRDAIGYKIAEEDTKFKVTNIRTTISSDL